MANKKYWKACNEKMVLCVCVWWGLCHIVLRYVVVLDWVETTGFERAGQTSSPGSWPQSEKASGYYAASCGSPCSCSSSNPRSSCSNV